MGDLSDELLFSDAVLDRALVPSSMFWLDVAAPPGTGPFVVRLRLDGGPPKTRIIIYWMIRINPVKYINI